jgi:hypothetical protein
MLKFKDFLLKEDLGIGPEGTSNNPSITNYMDSLKKDKKGFYVANSFQQLAELYKSINENQQQIPNAKKEQKIRTREAMKQKKQDS